MPRGLAVAERTDDGGRWIASLSVLLQCRLVFIFVCAQLGERCVAMSPFVVSVLEYLVLCFLQVFHGPLMFCGPWMIHSVVSARRSGYNAFWRPGNGSLFVFVPAGTIMDRWFVWPQRASLWIHCAD